MLKEQMNEVEGFPLKRVTTFTSVDGTGKTAETKTEMDVTEFRKVPIAASYFEIPRGYQQIDPNRRPLIDPE